MQLASTAFATLAVKVAQTVPISSFTRKLMAASTLDLTDPATLASILTITQQAVETNPNIALEAVQHPTARQRSVR